MNINNIFVNKECSLRLDEFSEKAKEAESICLFGAGRLGIKAYEILKANNIKIDYFCDNNMELWGKKIIGT